MKIDIVYLADHPECVPAVAAWVFQEWGRFAPGNTLEKVEDRFRTWLNRDRLPLALVALCGQEAVGTCSLVHQDLPARPDLSPWLAAVYVPAEYRSQGIGSQLVQEAEEIARRLGIDRLYLHTPDREGFYARLGWSTTGQAENRGTRVVIMEKGFSTYA